MSTYAPLQQKSRAREAAPSKARRAAARPGPRAGQLAALEDLANQGAQARRTARTHFSSNRTSVLQPRWNQYKDEVLVWSEPVGDLLWYFNTKTRMMSFKRKPESKISDDMAKQEGKWLPHGEWLAMGWGLFPEDTGKPITDYNKLKDKGKSRYEQMKAALSKKTGGRVDSDSQNARDWFFSEYYKTKTDDAGGGRINVSSDYKYPPKNMLEKNERGLGKYANYADPDKGLMVAMSNYALQGGERYYDPTAGKALRLSNSEILFQQWKMTAQGKKRPMKYMKRSKISGDGWKPLNAILNGTGKTKKNNPVYEEGTDGFFALLAIPNITSAIWLVVDHGQELGITGISSITITEDGSSIVQFTPSKL